MIHMATKPIPINKWIVEKCIDDTLGGGARRVVQRTL